MKRKEYQKPTMQVVKLQQRCRILSGSQPNASAEDFMWDQLGLGSFRPFFTE